MLYDIMWAYHNTMIKCVTMLAIVTTGVNLMWQKETKIHNMTRYDKMLHSMTKEDKIVSELTYMKDTLICFYIFYFTMVKQHQD